MSSYWKVTRTSSDCIHFIYSPSIDETSTSIISTLKSLKARVAFVNYEHAQESGCSVINMVASLLSLPHSPYPPRTSTYQPKEWVPFVDDLVNISKDGEVGALVIVINRGDLYLQESEEEFFEFIEAFLLQFSDWFHKEKPCHLCFQMRESVAIERLFSTFALTGND